VKILLSLVFPSGWKISYLPRGRRKGGLPLMIQPPSTKDQGITRTSPTSSTSLEEKMKKMKKAEVIEVKTEIIP
jgi:hypothetical protein